jgi:hypothetical protein
MVFHVVLRDPETDEIPFVATHHETWHGDNEDSDIAAMDIPVELEPLLSHALCPLRGLACIDGMRCGDALNGLAYGLVALQGCRTERERQAFRLLTLFRSWCWSNRDARIEVL